MVVTGIGGFRFSNQRLQVFPVDFPILLHRTILQLSQNIGQLFGKLRTQRTAYSSIRSFAKPFASRYHLAAGGGNDQPCCDRPKLPTATIPGSNADFQLEKNQNKSVKQREPPKIAHRNGVLVDRVGALTLSGAAFQSVANFGCTTLTMTTVMLSGPPRRLARSISTHTSSGDMLARIAPISVSVITPSIRHYKAETYRQLERETDLPNRLCNLHRDRVNG